MYHMSCQIIWVCEGGCIFMYFLFSSRKDSGFDHLNFTIFGNGSGDRFVLVLILRDVGVFTPEFPFLNALQKLVIKKVTRETSLACQELKSIWVFPKIGAVNPPKSSIKK